jgi:hypothetical protein
MLLDGVMPGQCGRCSALIWFWGIILLAQASLAPTVARQAGEAKREQRQAGGFGDGGSVIVG